MKSFSGWFAVPRLGKLRNVEVWLVALLYLFSISCTDPLEPVPHLDRTRHGVLADSFGLDPTTAMEWVLGPAGPDPVIALPVVDSCDLNDITEPPFMNYWVANTWPEFPVDGIVRVCANDVCINYVEGHQEQMSQYVAVDSVLLSLDTLYWIQHDSGAVYLQDSVFRTDFSAFALGTLEKEKLEIRIKLASPPRYPLPPNMTYEPLTGDLVYYALQTTRGLMINAVGRGECEAVTALAEALPSFRRFHVKHVGCDSAGWQGFHAAALDQCKCCSIADLRDIPTDSATHQLYLDRDWSIID